MDMGILTPIFVKETLPGDSWQCQSTILLRHSPLNAPLFHNVKVRYHVFYVSTRSIWPEFEQFITAGEDGNDQTVHPFILRSLLKADKGKLYDYLGVPAVDASNVRLNALPFRAWWAIYDEYYRDQQLAAKENWLTTSGQDTGTNTEKMMHCAWTKDYLTSARPQPQLGTAVQIPIGTTANVVGSGDNIPVWSTPDGNRSIQYYGSGSDEIRLASTVASARGSLSWNDPRLQADLTTATGVQITDLRLAARLQAYAEARNRYGSRYQEYCQYEYGVNPDNRLSVPEYVAGSVGQINFSEVLNMTAAAQAPQGVGDMYGHGIGALRSRRFRKFCPEHGFLIGVLSVVPQSTYQQALSRMWSREIREEYHQKHLERIGDQRVYNREVMVNHTQPAGIFGWQNRYDEYRVHTAGGDVAGDFNDTLNYWHMAREFSGDVALNQSFTDCVPTKRQAQVTNAPVVLAQIWNSMAARRPVTAKQQSVLM